MGKNMYRMGFQPRRMSHRANQRCADASEGVGNNAFCAAVYRVKHIPRLTTNIMFSLVFQIKR